MYNVKYLCHVGTHCISYSSEFTYEYYVARSQGIDKGIDYTIQQHNLLT